MLSAILKVLILLQAFAESSNWALLSWLCDDSDLHMTRSNH